MFTRYSGIEIPQNYSGNRFQRNEYVETDMKIHSSNIGGATKSSVSPSFEAQKIADFENKTENLTDITKDEVDINDNDEFEDISLDTDESKCDNCDTPKGIFNELSSFSNYFKSLQSEDLILIALILFLASDGSIKNNDIIIILALLLVYHT